MPAFLTFFAPRLITIALASYLLATNSKIAIISMSKKINLRRFNKSWLKILIKKGRYFIYKNRTIPAAIACIKEKLNSFGRPIFKILLFNLPIIIIIKIFLP